MDRHDRLNPLKKFACRKLSLKIYRNQTSLPVMTMDQIRPETHDWKDGQYRFGEKGKFLNICAEISIRFRTAEINKVVNKIIGNAFKLISHDAHMRARIIRTRPHVKMRNVLKIIPKLVGNTCIIRDHYSHVPFVFVKTFRQSAAYICKPSGLNEWYTL